MILIPAKLTCNHWSGCKNEIEIQLELIPGEQGIPQFPIHNHPKDWVYMGNSKWADKGDWYCPNHK